MDCNEYNLNDLFAIQKGKDLNEQLMTIKGTTLKKNVYGLLWDSELEKTLTYFVPTSLLFLMDMDYVYIKYLEDKWLQVQFLLFGEAQDIYLDFNTMKLVDKQLDGWFVYPIKSDHQKRFAIIHYPKEFNQTREPTDSYSSVLEALHQLDNPLFSTKIESSENIISEFIESKLKERNMTKSELADLLDMKYKTLISKFKIHSVTAEELIRMAMILNFDLNELKWLYQKNDRSSKQTPNAEMLYVATLIQQGFNEGIFPKWRLDVSFLDTYPLTKEEQLAISKEIEKGYCSGYLLGEPNRKWKLQIE